MSYGYTVGSDARDKMRYDYKLVMLATIPTILNIIVSVLFSLLSIENELVNNVFSLITSTIAGYATYKLFLRLVRIENLSPNTLFTPIKSFLNYLLWGFIVWVITESAGLFIQSDASDGIVLFMYELLRPFSSLLVGVRTNFGFIIRILLFLNITVFSIGSITLLLVHKFMFIPFYIIDEESIWDSIMNSWIYTNGKLGLIMSTLLKLLGVFMSIISLYLFIVLMIALHNPLAGTLLIDIILIVLLILLVLPYSFLVYTLLFANEIDGSYRSTKPKRKRYNRVTLNDNQDVKDEVIEEPQTPLDNQKKGKYKRTTLYDE